MPMKKLWAVWRPGTGGRDAEPLTVDEVRDGLEEPDVEYPIYAAFRTEAAAVAAAVRMANEGRDRLLAGPNSVRGMHEYLGRRGPYTAADLGVYGTPVMQDWLDMNQTIILG